MTDARLWLRLIEQWKPAGMGVAGPTLPFLIGATRVACTRSGTAGISDLGDLLFSLLGAKSQIRIASCTKLGQPVVGLCEENATMAHGDLIRKSSGGSSSLYVSREYPHKGNIDSVTDVLWKVVESVVKNGKYSYSGGTYEEYRPRDIEYIRRVLNGGG